MWFRRSASSLSGRLATAGGGPEGSESPPLALCAAGAGERDGGSGARPLEALPAAWFRDNARLLWRVVSRLGVPAHSVDDIVQEAFITASRRRVDIGEGRERSFLLATAIRLCANYRRRGHVRYEVSHATFDHEHSLAPDAEQLLVVKRWRALLERALSELSDGHREVFVLYELEGFSVPEISELLAVPLGTISSRLTRARVRFLEAAAELQRSPAGWNDAERSPAPARKKENP